MRRKLFIFTFTVVFLLFCVNTYAITGLTFTRSGNNFIYSNDPECFGIHRDELVYLWGTSLGTSYKDVEFYHNLYNGWDNNDSCRVGVAILNSNSTTATITYKGGSIIALDNNGSTDSLFLEYTPYALKSYFDASTQTIDIPPYTSMFVWVKDFNLEPGYSKTANFKYILPGGNHGNFDVSFD